MGTDLRAFLQHADADVAVFAGGALLQADRGRETGRPPAHDHHLIVHAFACLAHVDRLLPLPRALCRAKAIPVYNGPMQDKDPLATLAWLVEAGADEAIQETPVNRLKLYAVPPAAQPKP